MGIYLNSKRPATLYKAECGKPYFVDKTLMLEELFPLAETGNQFICVTRPRRFGKTVIANMISSFFGKNSTGSIFDTLCISDSNRHNGGKNKRYQKHLNQHNVICIDFSKGGDGCTNYQEYISTIKDILRDDLHEAYPHVKYRVNGSLSEDLLRITDQTDERFIFVFDEWDFIFHRDFISEKDRKSFLLFLSTLLKDQPYVELTYMTGILPIAKYSSGSELNMFKEFTLGTQHKYEDYFGFTESEVDMLYQRYLKNTPEPKVTREGLRDWYDGYHTMTGGRLYNPRSVVFALENDQLASYWTSSGPYDEIFYYVKNNIADVRDDIALMMAGESVSAGVQEYSATSTEIKTRDEILSAMAVYGFLTSNDGKVSIPNKELMDEFAAMAKKEDALGYVYRLARESEKMLNATKSGNTAVMERILQQAHDTEMGMLEYNEEAELSAVIKLVYLAAREHYDIQREDKAGTGYVDYIFYPLIDKSEDCIILELKIDHTADEAIQQIKDRNYAQRFIGKLGEQSLYKGRILAVGIAYFRKDKSKHHECKVEVLRERI